ncbi:transcription cofactor HES-6 isoform X3 [Hippocampus zosterae]|uniref:transcription cofactor HES-6 isoform X3 n=1 Tax=Hippocampus zosterae TaxID=109293 RepID=UPI00223DE8B3|nr:transcription cofactor HES-6 isoform X3 [Hippocampus zosterae]
MVVFRISQTNVIIRNCSFVQRMPPTRKRTPTDHYSGGLKSDRKMRKPLVEKKRRARINDSLHELRVLMADTEQFHSKMENAEVLEMTVKRVESILQNRNQEVDAINREACQRFAAGYIQCMHDVHNFVSSCPGMDPTVGAELLNHLLESMPLHGQDRLRATLLDADRHGGPWSPPAPSVPMAQGSLVSPAPSSSSASGDDLCSDLEDTDSEQSQGSSSEESEQSQVFSSEESEPQDVSGCVSLNGSKSVWRPW